jgi:hypothetical protein
MVAVQHERGDVMLQPVETPDERRESAPPSDMVWIAAGTFRIGSDRHYLAQLLPPLSPGRAACRTDRYLDQSRRLQMRP